MGDLPLSSVPFANRCLTFYPVNVFEIKMKEILQLTPSITPQAATFFTGFSLNTYCGRKNNDSEKRFKGLVRGMYHGNNMAARQKVTGVSVAEIFSKPKGQMDFFITFEVGYIISPKCSLSKARHNA